MTALTADLLLRAYAAGIFPMADSAEDPEIFWVDPEWRGFFDGLNDDARGSVTEAKGASWAPSRAARVILNGHAETGGKETRSLPAASGAEAANRSILDSVRAIWLSTTAVTPS